MNEKKREDTSVADACTRRCDDRNAAVPFDPIMEEDSIFEAAAQAASRVLVGHWQDCIASGGLSADDALNAIVSDAKVAANHLMEWATTAATRPAQEKVDTPPAKDEQKGAAECHREEVSAFVFRSMGDGKMCVDITAPEAAPDMRITFNETVIWEKNGTHPSPAPDWDEGGDD
jgi:hypothetical protein